MLNISSTISFSQKEENHIRTIYATGLSGPDMWEKNDDLTKSIKNNISKFTILNQQGRCVYCECILRKGDTAIEHFAPKESHREFTFHPKNLFSACGCCNSSSIKGRKDTISCKPKFIQYEQNTFSIVHPLLDNPNDHIKYADPDKTIFDLNACSAKGLSTISFFHWDTYTAYIDRVLISKARYLPINVNKLILDISTYKP